MKKRYVAISLTLGSLALAGGAQANAWNVIQKVTVGANTIVTQDEGNNAATQAMNAVNTLGTLNGTSQKVEMGIYTLGLSQTGATTTTSSQAANTVKADTISEAFSQEVNSTAAASAIALTQSAQGEANVQALNLAGATTDVGSSGVFAQKVTRTGTTGDITLTQLTDTGKDSVQAANVLAGKTVTSATQAVDNDTTGAGKITLVQSTGTDSLTQAVNYATAGTITSLKQNIKTVDLVLGQTGGTSNDQVGNYAKATTVVDTLLPQETDASGRIKMDQTDGSGNLQAVNAADVKSVTVAVTQAATTGATNINLYQNNQTNSQQFVNYLTSTGTVVSVTQDYKNSDKTATLVQDTATNSQQALNAIEMTGGSDVLTEGKQTVTLAILDMGQGESTANNASNQAANLLFWDNELVGATQTVSADIDLAQKKGTGNWQAVNSASGKIVTTKLTQTINGDSDYFTQGADEADSNLQAGNYLAVDATGTVASVVQEYSAATSVLMVQDDITSGVQGLNVIDASLSEVKVTSADQNVDVPALTMRQGQDGGTKTSVQAGNAVITAAPATGGTVDQDVRVTSLGMTQWNGNKSIQAVNYVGSMPY